MTDGWLMEADCIHGVVWYECAECCSNLVDPATLPTPTDIVHEGSTPNDDHQPPRHPSMPGSDEGTPGWPE